MCCCEGGRWKQPGCWEVLLDRVGTAAVGWEWDGAGEVSLRRRPCSQQAVNWAQKGLRNVAVDMDRY